MIPCSVDRRGYARCVGQALDELVIAGVLEAEARNTPRDEGLTAICYTEWVPATLALLLAVTLGTVAPGFTPEQLWQSWPQERYVTTVAPCLRPAELETNLRALAGRHPDGLTLDEAGRSFQGRPIYLLTLGNGPRKILLWSQMHGDEPSATPALLDVADYLLSRADEPGPEAILSSFTLLMVPMLNPDGAETYRRRNAQGIDVNRDALNLATPEGRLLKRLRDQHEPFLGFNLHDQNRRTAVGGTGVLATNAVLAVAGDPEGIVTPGRARAKRACAAIVEALAPFVPGGMARYDEDWSPRAFGDNLTAWGTPVVLIESGGVPPSLGFSDLTRLNFVALLSVLQNLARDDLAGYDPGVYEALERNRSDAWSDVVVRGGELLQPGTMTPQSRQTYRADLAFNLSREDRHAAGCGHGEPGGSRIVELGDGRFLAAGRDIDAAGSLVLAPFVVGARGWRARRWLGAETLEALARLGVGTVHWDVKRRRLDAAAALARQLEAPGRARLVATAASLSTAAAAPTWPVLTGPPAAPRSNVLRDVLAVLDGGRRGDWTFEDLQRLWPTGAESAPPVIRRGQPASFLLVSVAAGTSGLDEARLTSVWLDGRSIAAAVPWPSLPLYAAGPGCDNLGPWRGLRDERTDFVDADR